MIKLIRTDSDNTDFIQLVQHLDADLAEETGMIIHFIRNSIRSIKSNTPLLLMKMINP